MKLDAGLARRPRLSVARDRPRGVADVGLAAAELLEAAAGARDADGDARRRGCAFWNSSATASLIGKTVLEPSRVTSGRAAAARQDASRSSEPRSRRRRRSSARRPRWPSPTRSPVRVQHASRSALLATGSVSRAVSGMLIPRLTDRHRTPAAWSATLRLPAGAPSGALFALRRPCVERDRRLLPAPSRASSQLRRTGRPDLELRQSPRPRPRHARPAAIAAGVTAAGSRRGGCDRASRPGAGSRPARGPLCRSAGAGRRSPRGCVLGVPRR